MNLVLELPPKLQAELATEAAQLGLPLADYVLQLLAEGRYTGSVVRTGAQLLAYWQDEGLVGTRPEIVDAPAHARALREQAQKEGAVVSDGFLVDTDVLIDVQRGHPPALAWFAGLTVLPAVPGLVVMELIQDARNAREVKRARKLVAPLRVVWPTQPDCARALSDFTAYHRSHSLGLLDALIAACAVGLSATLNTFNDKHYRVVPGLVTAHPYTR